MLPVVAVVLATAALKVRRRSPRRPGTLLADLVPEHCVDHQGRDDVEDQQAARLRHRDDVVPGPRGRCGAWNPISACTPRRTWGAGRAGGARLAVVAGVAREPLATRGARRSSRTPRARGAVLVEF